MGSNLKAALERGEHLVKVNCIIIDVVDVCSKHSLQSLASLFGMGEALDLEGKTVTAAKAQIEEAAAKFPNADLSEIKNLRELNTLSERIDLFKKKAGPAVIQISRFLWRRTLDGSYIVMLQDGSISLLEDVVGEWNIAGRVNGKTLIGHRPTFDLAIKAADDILLSMGAVSFSSVSVRERVDMTTRPVDNTQRKICQMWNIPIPGDASFWSVQKLINEKKKARRRVA